MRTHGPRMNRVRTCEVVDKLGIHVEKSDARGIWIERGVETRCPGLIGAIVFTETERWRLTTGGGIAGNSDQVWLSPIVRVHGHAPRGPYWNKGQLEKALRAWRRGE